MLGLEKVTRVAMVMGMLCGAWRYVRVCRGGVVLVVRGKVIRVAKDVGTSYEGRS